MQGGLHDQADATALPARLLDAVPDAIIVFDQAINIRYANQAAMAFMRPDAGPVDPGGPPPVLDATTLVHPDDLEPLLLDLVPIIATPGGRGMARVRIVNGTEVRPIEVSFVNLLDDPHVGGIVASFRDLRGEDQARREAAAKQVLIERNESLREELEERQDFQARLLQIQQSISRRMPVADVLLAVVEGAHALLGDELVVLCLEDPDDGTRTLVESIDGVLERTDEDSACCTPRSLDRFARDADELVVIGPGDGGIVGRHEVGGGMAVPIRDRDRALGSLAVATRSDERVYSSLEREMLVNLAEHASVALMDARTVESVQLAMRDSLTGLPTRSLLMDRLAQSVERCARDGDPVVVLFIDLARFKGINDSYGHAVGDEVLAAVGRRIASTMREYDTAARLGGDEFVVVLEGVSAREAICVAQRLLIEIRKPIPVAQRVLYANATIGVAMGLDGPIDGRDPELLLRQADIAMYQGKTTGEDIVFFEPAMQSELVVRQELESDLRRAVTERELQVAFQPLVDLGSGAVYGVEALARWDHPTRGRIAPDLFIVIAEEVGAIVELDRLVWALACAEAATWVPTAEGHAIRLSLNLSARHLLATDLMAVLAGILASTGLAPARVTLEITETELMHDLPAAIEQMWALRSLGVELAIDDFGTGYSSLAYLQQLPVGTLKIDRGFVGGMDRDPKAVQLVRAMVNLAHGFGLRVVAEGVETAQEADALRAMGADVGQGYLFARPLTPDALRDLLTARPPAADHTAIADAERSREPTSSSSPSTVHGRSAGASRRATTRQ